VATGRRAEAGNIDSNNDFRPHLFGGNQVDQPLTNRAGGSHGDLLGDNRPHEHFEPVALRPQQHGPHLVDNAGDYLITAAEMAFQFGEFDEHGLELHVQGTPIIESQRVVDSLVRRG